MSFCNHSHLLFTNSLSPLAFYSLVVFLSLFWYGEKDEYEEIVLPLEKLWFINNILHHQSHLHFWQLKNQTIFCWAREPHDWFWFLIIHRNGEIGQSISKICCSVDRIYNPYKFTNIVYIRFVFFANYIMFRKCLDILFLLNFVFINFLTNYFPSFEDTSKSLSK